MPLNVEDLKKKHGQNATNVPKKPPLVPPLSEPFFEDTEPVQPESPDVLNKKRELIKKLFDENAELPMEEMLTTYFTQGEGKKMGKTVSPLKGIREGLEDILNIQQLNEIIKGFRTMKNEPKKEDEEENSMGNNNLLTMLPFLQKMQSGGMDAGKLDPTMLMLAMGMGGQKQSNNNMGQLFLMMSMANMFAQQPQQQVTPNGNPIPQANAINMEMIKSLYKELQNVMQQQQKPAIDPVTLMMINSIQKSNQQPQGIASNQNIEVLLDKFNSMMTNNQTQQMALIMERSNERFERGMREIAGALNKEDPRGTMMQDFEFFRNITGDKRERSQHEMEYDLKKKEIELKEYARRDMLDREERDKEREDAKGQRIMDTAGIVLDKVIGNGLGALMGDFMSLKGGKKSKGKGTPNQPRQDYDPSLLDDL